MRIARSQLGPLTKIAEGGFGCVYRAPACTLDGEPDPLAYKEFTSKVAEQATAAAACVDLWTVLSTHERRVLGSCAAWPRALVTDGRTVCGLLMPLLGDEFFYTSSHPKTGTSESRPRAMSWLISTHAQRTAARVDVPDVDLVDRLVLLARLAYALALLHRMGWVYGDLSFNNVAFALGPPSIRLLDCDAAAPLSNAARRQANTPFWEPPELGNGTLQDALTDTYKLGLAVLRCVTPGAGAASSRDPARLNGELDLAGAQLIARALSDDRADRPTAKEIYLHLSGLLNGRIVPPAVLRAQLVKHALLRGQDARLEWDVDGADTLLIEAPNGQRLQLDPQQHPNGYSFRPQGSGPVTLTVSNRFGSARVELGDVDLYDLPKFDIGRVRLPQPAIGSLQAFSTTDAAAAAAMRPPTYVGAGLGSVPTVDTSGILAGLEPFSAPPVTLSPWSGVLEGAAGPVRAVVANAGAAVASAVRSGLTDARWDASGNIR